MTTDLGAERQQQSTDYSRCVVLLSAKLTGFHHLFLMWLLLDEQESPAIADKPARRESLPKIAPIRRAYNVVADNTGLSSCV